LAAVVRADDKVDFSRDILPLLSENCFQCHGPDAKNRKAKLRLDDEQNVKNVRGVVVPGKSDESELFLRVSDTDAKHVMPPPSSQRKLSPQQIALLKRWIDEGASWGVHWAFQPLVRPAVPPLASGRQVRNPLDAFILARLEKEKLTPSAPAPRETLLRRVCLDLTGLPPTLAEVDAFLNDKSDDAYEKVVDQLLASPTFGERMAWDWLEAARYADSNGFQGDKDRTMWPWRDWVVEAFNRNMPYDQFTHWQLAGDLLPEATNEQKMATAFCRNHLINGEGGRIAEESRVDYVMDMTETMGTVWLGLTLNCCRCHDHKYDPFAQREYYQLFSFFNQTPVDGKGDNAQTPPVLEYTTPEQAARRARLDQVFRDAAEKLESFEDTQFPRPEGKTADQSEKATELSESIKAILKTPAAKRKRPQLVELAKRFDKQQPAYAELSRKLQTALDGRDNFNKALPRVMVMEEQKKPRQTFILDKGLYDKRGEVVTADVPSALPSISPDSRKNRLELSRWLTAPENPLTARVTVNRFWQQFFGVGIVKTVDDFGLQGERPSHPELLDWLAVEFRDGGWDVKKLCKLIVMSDTYRQSSKVTPQLLECDPNNRLLARGPRLRMPSWMLRDQALAVSGLAVQRLGGPPVRPYQPTGIWEEATFGTIKYRQDKGEALYRRSLYTFWRRIVGPTMFFDSAPRQVCSVKQVRTNSPLHALTTLNDITYVEAARALAQRVLTEAGAEPQDRLERAFRLVLARRPTPAETTVLLASLDKSRLEFTRNPDAAAKLLSVGESPRNHALDPVEHAAYAAVCSAILNLDEALTKE
jgi:hypothetical protein